MNYEEYKNKIAQEVGRLTQREKVVLCLVSCFRLFPLYEKFSEIEHWGKSSTLLEVQSLAKRWLSGESADTRLLAVELESVVPDMDDFGTVLGSYALNAGLAHMHLLEQIKCNDNHHAIYSLLGCYDTIDFYVQDLLDSESKDGVPEAEIEKHSNMVNEIKWQLSIFSEIKNSASFLNLVQSYKKNAIISLA